MTKTIYILGNELEKKDSLPLKIKTNLEKKLPDFNFVLFDPTEENEISESPVFLDSVRGISRVTVFDDLTNFAVSPRNTVHDFDLPVYLGLSLKLKKIGSYKIIGIPEKYSVKKAISEVIHEIRRI